MSEQPEHIMQFFAYEHLPPHLQAVSKPFCDLARSIVAAPAVAQCGEVVLGIGPCRLPTGHAGTHQAVVRPTPEPLALPRNPERTVALRKLLEAKDAAVRAFVAK